MAQELAAWRRSKVWGLGVDDLAAALDKDLGGIAGGAVAAFTDGDGPIGAMLRDWAAPVQATAIEMGPTGTAVLQGVARCYGVALPW